MLKLSTFRTALILLLGALAAVACTDRQNSTPPLGEEMPVVTTSLRSSTPPVNLSPKKKPSHQTNSYELALDKAYSAFSISQSAESLDDWLLVTKQWQDAISLLKAVPTTSHNKMLAQKKIAEYQRNLTYAQHQATHLTKENSHSVVAIIPETPSSSLQISGEDALVVPSMPPSQPVFRATIAHRIGGTPVINVTFNNTHQFEMIVDTGASQTVITQQMASALKVVSVATAKANTASDSDVRFSIGYVNSMQVSGAVVKDVPVAIAPSPNLAAGLLGHDFFENYDVTFKRDVVEFRPR